jgi:adenylate kinase
MKIIVVSVPGGGKSTVLKFVKKKMPKAKIITYGDLFLREAKKKYGITDRDELRKKLTLEQQDELQYVVADKISRMRARILFINTHILIKTPFGYFQALSEKRMKIINPDMIVILEFNPEDILERRIADKKRKRDIESLEDIEKHQIDNRKAAFDVAKSTNCPVKIINLRFKEKKSFDQARKGAEEIIKLVKAIGRD